MKPLYAHRLLYIFILCLWHFAARAQQISSSCNESLYKANRLYEQGHFQEAVNLLEPCVRNISPDIRFEAYRLLAICYINLNEPGKAENAAEMLLLHKPSYKEFPYVDPVELNKMLSNYTIRNLADVGIKVGCNISSVRLWQYQSATNSSSSFYPKAGFEAGLTLNYHFLPHVSVAAEALYAGLSYGQQSDDVNGWKMHYHEGLNYFSFPLLLKYDFDMQKKFSASIEAGMQWQMLSRSQSNLRFDNPATGEGLETAMNYYDSRTAQVYGLVAGIQLRKQLSSGIFGMGIRYAYGLKNIVDPEKRYDDPEFISYWRYLYSDISLNTFCISLTYQLPLKYTVNRKQARLR